jgi:cysteinyl-tRNA synthetase
LQAESAEANGSIYFDVVKFNETNHYGRLSGRNIEDMLPILVILMDNLTKETQDFALWKKQSHSILCAGPPLRRRFPGWHLECTAMSTNI